MFQLGIYPQLLLPTVTMLAVSAKAVLRWYYRWSRRKVGTTGPSTATLAIGGEALPKLEITFMSAPCRA